MSRPSRCVVDPSPKPRSDPPALGIACGQGRPERAGRGRGTVGVKGAHQLFTEVQHVGCEIHPLAIPDNPAMGSDLHCCNVLGVHEMPLWLRQQGAWGGVCQGVSGLRDRWRPHSADEFLECATVETDRARWRDDAMVKNLSKCTAYISEKVRLQVEEPASTRPTW